jgi:hypothetical protein
MSDRQPPKLRNRAGLLNRRSESSSSTNQVQVPSLSAPCPEFP